MPWVPADGSKGGDNVRSEPRQPETRQRGTRRIDQTGRLARGIQTYSEIQLAEVISKKNKSKSETENQPGLKSNFLRMFSSYATSTATKKIDRFFLNQKCRRQQRTWQQRIRHNLAATSRCQLPASTGDDELRQQSFRAALPMHVQSVASAPGFYKQTFFWRKWKEIWARKKKNGKFFKMKKWNSGRLIWRVFFQEASTEWFKIFLLHKLVCFQRTDVETPHPRNIHKSTKKIASQK